MATCMQTCCLYNISTNRVAKVLLYEYAKSIGIPLGMKQENGVGGYHPLPAQSCSALLPRTINEVMSLASEFNEWTMTPNKLHFSKPLQPGKKKGYHGGTHFRKIETQPTKK